MKEVEDFENEVINSELPVLVDFWAAWCNPCRTLIPVLEQIEDSLSESVKFVKVNADNNSELLQKYGIRGLPTLILFKGGEVLKTFVGSQIKDELMDSIKTALFSEDLPDFHD